MRRIAATILSLGLILKSSAASDQVHLGNTSHKIAAGQINTLAELANSGSASAAIRLSDHYFYDDSRSEKPAIQGLALHWTTIGAENGSSEAQFRLYQFMARSNDKLTKIRALYWLKQAAKNGDDKAQVVLSGCPSIDAMVNPRLPCFGSDDGTENGVIPN